MVNKQFEAYKIQRELKRSGLEYTFIGTGVNDVGEPTDEPVDIGTFRGIYHEQNSHIQITVGDTTQIRTKKVPCILCLFEDGYKLAVGNYTTINGKKFTVTGVVNVQEWSIIADVSLEIIDTGGV